MCERIAQQHGRSRQGRGKPRASCLSIVEVDSTRDGLTAFADVDFQAAGLLAEAGRMAQGSRKDRRQHQGVLRCHAFALFRLRVAAAFLAEADRSAGDRDAAAAPPSLPPFLLETLVSGTSRPLPDLFPPPVSLFTVAQCEPWLLSLELCGLVTFLNVLCLTFLLVSIAGFVAARHGCVLRLIGCLEAYDSPVPANGVPCCGLSSTRPQPPALGTLTTYLPLCLLVRLGTRRQHGFDDGRVARYEASASAVYDLDLILARRSNSMSSSWPDRGEHEPSRGRSCRRGK